MTTGTAIFAVLIVLYAALLERFQEVSRPADTLIAAATWTILLSVLAHGLSATPLSGWYARRLAAAKEPRSSWSACPSYASAAASWQARRGAEGSQTC